MVAISETKIFSPTAPDEKFYRPSCLTEILVPFPSSRFLLKNTIFLTKKGNKTVLLFSQITKIIVKLTRNSS